MFRSHFSIYSVPSLWVLGILQCWLSQWLRGASSIQWTWIGDDLFLHYMQHNKESSSPKYQPTCLTAKHWFTVFPDSISYLPRWLSTTSHPIRRLEFYALKRVQISVISRLDNVNHSCGRVHHFAHHDLGTIET